MHHLLKKSTNNHFNKIALLCDDKELTFGELDGLANSLARILRERGIGRGKLVGIALDRSIELVVVLLGVSKTGAAYLPIDPAFPSERIRHIIDDAEPKLIVVRDSIRVVLAGWEGACLNVDKVRDDMANSKDERGNIEVHVRAEDLAYVTYTSGSTGKPKGVEISHGALSNLLCSMQREPGCNEMDRLLAIITISFDIAVLELFLPLLCGATTVLAQSNEINDPCALLRLMERHKITMMQATPATWQMLIDVGWKRVPHLSKILCGGDVLSQRLAERLLPCADSVCGTCMVQPRRLYGPVYGKCRGHDVVIGRPVTNYRLYVLDEELSPVPLGCEGELHIGGAGLARATSTSPSLLGHASSTIPSTRAFYIARVKVRGHRVELGDIEAAVTTYRDISDTVVVSKDDRLAAYYVLNTNLTASGDLGKPTLENLMRLWLAKRLPMYMIPAFFVELDAFPMTLNGKIDRKALPHPIEALQLAKAKPETEMECIIRSIWSSVLDHDRIGIFDNFFQIGGDSMPIVRVHKELEKLFSQSVSLVKLFEHYTIRSLAAYLVGAEEIDQKPVVPQRYVQDNDDIAIISMACRLPGESTFWS